MTEGEANFKRAVRAAATTAGLPVVEVFSLPSTPRFVPEIQEDGSTSGIQYITLTLGVEIGTDDLEELDALYLPEFPRSAWKLSES
ncbi:hypothetical protein EEB14_22965 [Rhodococcus sp. WS4]|nr:hypothetical protein EEB14_22965 [Rhodococcus sp. WS4]